MLRRRGPGIRKNTARSRPRVSPATSTGTITSVMSSPRASTPSAEDLFEVLLHEHAPMLRVYLKALVADPGLADDLFQETALVAWRRLSDFDHTRPFGPWLRGIARRLLLANTSRDTDRGTASVDPVTIEGLCAIIERRRGDTFDERVSDLRACVAELPPESADLIRRHYWGRATLPQLADGPPSEVERLKKRLQRARGRIAECLERKGWFRQEPTEAAHA